MSYRSFMGKYYLSDSDWDEINDRAADIREYYKEIQAEIRRQEELERKRERERQNNQERKRAREYLEEIEDLLEDEIEEEEEEPIVEGRFSAEPYDSSSDNRVRYSLLSSDISTYDAFDQNELSCLQDVVYGTRMTRGIPMNMTFTEQLYHLIKQKGKTNAEVYKAANIDKSLFSRITSDKHYSPSKDTAISICLALKLTLEEAKDLLDRAGYSISHSILKDAAIEYCFLEKIYNVIEVNILLDKLGCSPLSRIRY